MCVHLLMSCIFQFLQWTFRFPCCPRPSSRALQPRNFVGLAFLPQGQKFLMVTTLKQVNHNRGAKETRNKKTRNRPNTFLVLVSFYCYLSKGPVPVLREIAILAGRGRSEEASCLCQDRWASNHRYNCGKQRDYHFSPVGA